MPYALDAAILPDTLICGSTDIQTLDGVDLLDLSGLLAPGIRRGEDEVIPRKQGLVGASGLVFDAFAFSLPVLVSGTTRADMFVNLHALADACTGTGGLVDLTRRRSASGGHVDGTADGRFVGFAALNFADPAAVHTAVETELQFVNLSGAWFEGATWIFP